MHDKNGKPLKTGDRVKVEAVIGECYSGDEYCNVQLKIGYEADNGPSNVHAFVTLNSKQVELLED
ncbi:MAG: hypothetical protein KIS76_03920 [Pyrinomonadaceae bacterium]|nr:hypothetical protein [Pyrinomonadaceae bacterium]